MARPEHVTNYGSSLIPTPQQPRKATPPRVAPPPKVEYPATPRKSTGSLMYYKKRHRGATCKQYMKQEVTDEIKHPGSNEKPNRYKGLPFLPCDMREDIPIREGHEKLAVTWFREYTT